MAFLTDDDRRRILDAIRRAEMRTSGEFVTVMAAASGRYTLVRFAAPALIALMVPFVMLGFGLSTDAVVIAQVQLLIFLVLASVLQWTRAALWFVPVSVQKMLAQRLARAQFMDLGLHRTADRAGVLLFVSIAEHHVEILADRGIAERVDPDAWQRIVDGFIRSVRSGHVADGFVSAIDACGDLMARSFPCRPDDRNELPDVFIEL